MVRKQKGGGQLGSTIKKDKQRESIKKAEYIRVGMVLRRNTRLKE